MDDQRTNAVMDNVPKVSIFHQERGPTQKVKFKDLNVINGNGQALFIHQEGSKVPLSHYKGPEMEDDVKIASSPKDDLGLREVVFPKSKQEPAPQPVQRQESSCLAININSKIKSNVSEQQPRNVGLSKATGEEPDLTKVLNKKSELSGNLKRRRPKNESVIIIEQKNYQSTHDELNKTKEVMVMATDFNNNLGISREVIFDKDLEEEDRSCQNILRHKISGGSFGTVYGFESKRNRNIVVKKLNQDVDSKEIITPYKLEHPGIVRMLGVKCVPGHFFIFMENAGLSLKCWIKDDGFRSYVKQNLVNFCETLFRIVSWLEIHCIAHRDIKPENICVEKRPDCSGVTFVPKLIDFGSAQASQDPPCLNGHTPEFLPPFLNRLIYYAKTGQKYSVEHHFFEQKSDNFAISLVIIWIMLHGRHPITMVNNYSSDPKIMDEQRKMVMQMIIGMKDEFLERYVKEAPEPIQTALWNALRVDNKVRWNASSVCQHLENESHKSQPKKKCPMKDDEEDLYDFFDQYVNSKQDNVIQPKPSTNNWRQPQTMNWQQPQTNIWQQQQTTARQQSQTMNWRQPQTNIWQEQQTTARQQSQTMNWRQPQTNIWQEQQTTARQQSQTNNCPQQQTNLDLNFQMKTGVKPNMEVLTVEPGMIQNSAVKMNVEKSQEPELIMFNIKSKSNGVSILNPAPPASEGNIPNMDLLNNDLGLDLTKTSKVLYQTPPVQLILKEEDVSLVPNLHLLENDPFDAQRQPRRKLQGRRRSSNNKAMH